jgi:hypothetical protein
MPDALLREAADLVARRTGISLEPGDLWIVRANGYERISDEALDRTATLDLPSGRVYCGELTTLGGQALDELERIRFGPDTPALEPAPLPEEYAGRYVFDPVIVAALNRELREDFAGLQPKSQPEASDGRVPTQHAG